MIDASNWQSWRRLSGFIITLALLHTGRTRALLSLLLRCDGRLLYRSIADHPAHSRFKYLENKGSVFRVKEEKG